MKLLKTIGILLLLASGYFIHAIAISNRPLQAKLYLAIVIVILIHTGIAAMVAQNGTSFKKSFSEAIMWPLHFLP